MSVAICSRNDDHGGNMMRRMTVSLLGLLEQLERHRIESELILVDYNPPANRPRLKEALPWPSGLRWCTVRIYEVDEAVHRKFPHADKIALRIVEAVNTGIRRSRGAFVLPQTVDALYPDALMRFLARRELKVGERYRLDRVDVDRSVLNVEGLDEQIRYAADHVLMRHRPNPRPSIEGVPPLHTNACGDFQLMAGRHWKELRGYRETEARGAKIDNLLSYAALANGIRETVLPDELFLYHIDHDEKHSEVFTVVPPWYERVILTGIVPKRFQVKAIKRCRRWFGSSGKRMAHGLPSTSIEEYQALVLDMLGGRRSPVLNGEGWGLGGEALPEFVVSRAAWEGTNRP